MFLFRSMDFMAGSCFSISLLYPKVHNESRKKEIAWN
jgi:hypothetical protein